MKNFLVILTTLLVLGLTSQGSGFDRAAAHSARLEGLDIGSRTFKEAGPATPASSGMFSDLQVSWSIPPARFTQDNSDIGALADGGWLSVWDDNRYGSYKIFSQRLDSLLALSGDNLLMAGSSTGANIVEPRLAVDTLGRVYLFYRDRTRGLILGSRFNPDLTADLAEFLVNDTSSESFAGPFDLAIFPDGRMVVVWENYSALGSTISMRVYNASGGSVAGPVAVNSEGGSAQHWVPRVAVEPGSGYLVVWEDYRNGNADIYARLFLGDGSPVGSDLAIVPPPADTAIQFAPRVAFTEPDKYVIGWVDRRQGQELYLQRYDPDLGLVGSNLIISGGDTLVANQDLDLAVSPDGKLLASWGAFGADNSLMATRFDSGLIMIGTPLVHNLSSVGRRWSPSAEFSDPNRYGLTWTEFQDEDADIHFMSFDSTGVRFAVEEIRMNRDDIGAPSESPTVIASTDWYDLIAWTDRRRDAGDIYLEAVSNAGIPLYGNIRVNQDVGPDLQGEPSLAVSDNKSLTVWIDGRPLGGYAGQRIFGRYASLLGVFSEDEFLISDTNQTAIKGSPKTILLPSGQGLVVWQDRRIDSSSQVWGRWIAPDGSLDGGEFQISNEATDIHNMEVHSSCDSLGRFYVVWLDKNGVGSTVRGRWFNNDKSDGGIFEWESSLPGIDVDDIAVEVNRAGEIILLWSGIEGSVRNVYLTRLTADGTVLTSPFLLNDDPSADVAEVALSVSENGYLSATWVDRRDGTSRVYYQILDNLLTTIGANQPISTAVPEFMKSPATAAQQGRAWFAWADPRANGLSIYAANVVYLPTDIVDSGNDLVPVTFHLGQNYPNPFNPTTTIRFTLPATTELTMSVHNLLGQEVTILADGVFPAGDHRVVWDGRGSSGEPVASGVYFYQLKADTFVERRKMLLLK